jgi:hypothetical protein
MYDGGDVAARMVKMNPVLRRPLTRLHWKLRNEERKLYGVQEPYALIHPVPREPVWKLGETMLQNPARDLHHDLERCTLPKVPILSKLQVFFYHPRSSTP